MDKLESTLGCGVTRSRPMTLEEVQQVEFSTLEKVEAFCKAHELTYYLTGGTLLGAVRHGDFIPWDDDIDIAMPRPDYDRFVRLFRDQNGLCLRSANADEQCLFGFAKVIDERTCFREKDMADDSRAGVFVDVFPIDGASSRAWRRRVDYWIFWVMRKLVLHSGSRVYPDGPCDDVGLLIRRTCSNIVKRFLSRRQARALLGLMDRFVRRHLYENSEWVANYWGAWGLREFVPREFYRASLPLYFRDGWFPAPTEWDRYLAAIYGDYMTPPSDPPTGHGSAYWRE